MSFPPIHLSEPSYPVLITFIVGFIITVNAYSRFSTLNKRIRISGFSRDSITSSGFIFQVFFGITTMILATLPQSSSGIIAFLLTVLLSFLTSYLLRKPFTLFLKKNDKKSKKIEKALYSVNTSKAEISIKDWSNFGELITIPIDKIDSNLLEKFVQSYQSRVKALKNHKSDSVLEVNGFRFLGAGNYHSSWLCLKSGLVFKERKEWLNFNVSKADFERINLMSELDLEKLLQQGARHAFTTSVLLEVSGVKVNDLDLKGFGGPAIITIQEYVKNSVPIGSSSPFELNLITEEYGFDIHNGKIGVGSIEQSSPVVYDCLLPRSIETISIRDLKFNY